MDRKESVAMTRGMQRKKTRWNNLPTVASSMSLISADEWTFLRALGRKYLLLQFRY